MSGFLEMFVGRGKTPGLERFNGTVNCSYRAILFLGGALGHPLSVSLIWSLGNIGSILFSSSLPLFICSSLKFNAKYDYRDMFSHSFQSHIKLAPQEA